MLIVEFLMGILLHSSHLFLRGNYVFIFIFLIVTVIVSNLLTGHDSLQSVVRR